MRKKWEGRTNRLTLRFAYTVIGDGIFLHSLHPLAMYEIINSTSRTVQLHSATSDTPIHAPPLHFSLQRSHLNELNGLTIETTTASLSLATALLRLQSRGRDVFTEQQSLPWSSLLDRLDGTSRLLHSGIHMP